MDCVIRSAEAKDVKAMLEIYAPYVLNTAYSFEYSVPSEEEFCDRVKSTQEAFPWLVYESDGIVAGYAYAHRPFSREAYSWCAEVSVYISPVYQHRGVGKALYEKLIGYLRQMGCCVIYATIESENAVSLSFHRKLGFTDGPVFKDSGYKLGKWRSLCWLTLRLSPPKEAPGKFVPYTEIENKV